MAERRDTRRMAKEIGLVRQHARTWRENLYVYPVLSRRAGGLSVGVNLNPDKRCTFGCVYCQVDRHLPAAPAKVDLAKLAEELSAMLSLCADGAIWREEAFASVPAELRRVNDIAFSGDGEPTTCPEFPEAVRIAAEAKAAHHLADVKIVVITNATFLQSEGFRQALPILQANGGEVWAKLDAGTEGHYRRVNRSGVAFQRVLDNLLWLARQMPIVIQTMLLRLDGQGPGPEELDAYLGRLREIVAQGGRIKLVQLYTIARPPAEGNVAALSDAELDAAAERVRAGLAGVPVETYYGAEVPQQQQQG